MKTLLLIGITLLLLSAYPLYLMAVEAVIGRRAYQRYEVQQNSGTKYDYKSAEFYGHKVVLSDNLELQPEASPKNESIDVKAPISIIVDGKDYSLPSPIEVSVYNDSKSYNSWVAILNLTDRERHEERLAIVQRVAGEKYPDDGRYRILFVQPNGTVTEEWFKYSERAEPVYRTMLATFAHPEYLGFRSNIAGIYPSIIFPILYPLLTGLVGLILFAIGAIVFLIRRRRNDVALH